MIDARKYHDPAKAPGLIAHAIEAVGTQRELADRVGVTVRTLRQLARRERDMSYSLQVVIERVINETRMDE